MRRAARVDGNQQAIIDGLREVGVAVQPLHAVGGGVPDLLCSWKGVNVLLEVKDPTQDPNKRKLTPAQVEWHANWQGPCFVVDSVTAARMRIYEAAEAA